MGGGLVGDRDGERKGGREGGMAREGNKSEIKAREHIDRCDVIPAAKIHISGWLCSNPVFKSIYS